MHKCNALVLSPCNSVIPGGKVVFDSCSDHARGKPSTAPLPGDSSKPEPVHPLPGAVGVALSVAVQFFKVHAPDGEPPTDLTLYRASYPVPYTVDTVPPTCPGAVPLSC